MRDFGVGQRWISEAEPELGLGTLVVVDDRHVEIEFRATGDSRRYAKATAPLSRARFHAGDLVRAADGRGFVVREVEESAGFLTYVGDGDRLREDELSPILGAEGPAERLRRGLVDPRRLFDLRQEALAHLHRTRTSAVRGLVGARIQLLPHQLFIAREVSAREAPRVLLADEVGLGKTIEACLVAHEMLLSGRAERVLVLVPEHLVHQWFVELLRRFDLRFRIFDEERCAAIEEGRDVLDEPGGPAARAAAPAAAGAAAPDAAAAADPSAEAERPNPFLDEQIVLCALPLLVGSARRRVQAIAAGWDLLIVDEAHHLAWSPGAPSPEYEVVEALAGRSDGVLLLTGTPSQLGEEGHFARLRLLDPARHGDLDRYRVEAAAYADVAARLEAPAAAPALPDDGSIVAEPEAPEDEDAMLDRYGPGRVMFRNTRASIGGFKRRLPRPQPLAAPQDGDLARLIAQEIDLRGRRSRGELEGFACSHAGDPRIAWLAGLLRSLAPEKLLVIVQSPEQVAAIADALSREVTVKRAVFHEGLSLVQRDRNAAWFAEKDGARLLLCSEIGSEGRNFQFVHDLALFDLPLDPELLEQRIGRLDRIGQSRDIAIHVPVIAGSAQEVLYRWYSEGLDAFARPVPDGNALLERFGARVAALARGRGEPGFAAGADEAAIAELVRESRAARDQLAERLARGRDRLLERSSYRPARASRIVAEVARLDDDRTLETLMHRVFDHYGIEAEEVGERTLRLSAERLYVDAFPGLPADGATVTFSRAVALEREDAAFLTWDHSMVQGALELLVGSGTGTCSFVVADGGRPGLVVEATFVVESPAPRRLGIARFLPATPVVVAVDPELEERAADLVPAGSAAGDEAAAGSAVRDAPSALREGAAPLLRELLPAMLGRARAIAEERAAGMVAEAAAGARAALAGEIARLEALARVNDQVRPEEIERLRTRSRDVDAALRRARPRLDAIRLVWRGPTPG